MSIVRSARRRGGLGHHPAFGTIPQASGTKDGYHATRVRTACHHFPGSEKCHPQGIGRMRKIHKCAEILTRVDPFHPARYGRSRSYPAGR